MTALVVGVAAALVEALSAQAPAPAPASGTAAFRPASTMNELMADVIYPTSDAVLYITSRTPTTPEEWQALQMKTLMLAESGILLTLPGRVRPGDVWMENARAMYDVGVAAYKAAKARDVDALAELNDPLYNSCVNCHLQYRPNYGRGRQPAR